MEELRMEHIEIMTFPTFYMKQVSVLEIHKPVWIKSDPTCGSDHNVEEFIFFMIIFFYIGDIFNAKFLLKWGFKTLLHLYINV